MAAGHAGHGPIIKSKERPGRGCDCCPSFPLRENGRRSRQVARRRGKQELRILVLQEVGR